jgi:hypothetical protein
MDRSVGHPINHERLERAKQNRGTSSPNSVRYWKQCNFCKSAGTRDEPFSCHFTQSLDQNWTKIDPRKLRSSKVECPVQVSPSKSPGARSCPRRPVLLRRVQIGGPTPPLPQGERSGHGDQHSVLNEVLMLEVIESLSRVGSNRGHAFAETDIHW